MYNVNITKLYTGPSNETRKCLVRIEEDAYVKEAKNLHELESEDETELRIFYFYFSISIPGPSSLSSLC